MVTIEGRIYTHKRRLYYAPAAVYRPAGNCPEGRSALGWDRCGGGCARAAWRTLKRPFSSGALVPASGHPASRHLVWVQGAACLAPAPPRAPPFSAMCTPAGLQRLGPSYRLGVPARRVLLGRLGQRHSFQVGQAAGRGCADGAPRGGADQRLHDDPGVQPGRDPHAHVPGGEPAFPPPCLPTRWTESAGAGAGIDSP